MSNSTTKTKTIEPVPEVVQVNPLEEAQRLLAQAEERNANELLEGYRKLVEETGFELFPTLRPVEVQPGIFGFAPEIAIRKVKQ